MKLFYHGDLDGHCSGAIAYRVAKSQGKDVELYEGKYGMSLENIPFKKDDEIVVVDYSFQKKGQWEYILGFTNNITWIDHHKTSIDDYEHYGFKGIRLNGTAACELTWKL